MRRIFVFWLVTRIWLSFWAVVWSINYPATPLEKRLGIWPPLEGWLARIILAPWYRWDVEHFLKIAAQGYRVDDGTSSFHPLYPWMGRAVGAVFGGHDLLGLFIVSNICSLLFLISLERLARLDLSPEESYRASFYFVLLPAGFILFAPYTESLFLLLSVLAFLMARQGRWVWAGLAGACAVLTRQQGIFLLVPLAWELWEWSGKEWRKLLSAWRNALGLLFVPAGLLLWLFYRALTLGDIVIDWRRPQSLIYGLLISRSAAKVVPDQSFVMPWEAIRLALSYQDTANVVDLCAGGTYLLLLAVCWRRLWRLRQSYLIYSAVIIAVSFSYSTGLDHAYMGLPRHCLLAFPLILALAIFGKKPAAHLIYSAIGMIWLMAMTLFYVCEILWVP